LKLDIKQINNLCTGIKLATELESSHPDLRKFLTVQGYRYNDNGKIIELDKILKANISEKIFFELRCYELSQDYFINNWDVTEDDLASEVYLDDIRGIELLEEKLSDFIEDYSVLKPEWYCDSLL